MLLAACSSLRFCSSGVEYWKRTISHVCGQCTTAYLHKAQEVKALAHQWIAPLGNKGKGCCAVSNNHVVLFLLEKDRAKWLNCAFSKLAYERDPLTHRWQMLAQTLNSLFNETNSECICDCRISRTAFEKARCFLDRSTRKQLVWFHMEIGKHAADSSQTAQRMHL